MANRKHPGFYPMQWGDGGQVVYRRRQVTSNNSNAINLWDAVDQDTNGNILGFATSGQRTTSISSVMTGASFQDANGVRNGAKSLPASTTYSGTGIWPPDAIFVTVVDNVTNVALRCSLDTLLTRAALDANFAINLAAGASGFSQQDVQASSANNTATLPLRLVDFVNSAENDLTSATNQWVICAVNAGVQEPALSASTGLA